MPADGMAPALIDWGHEPTLHAELLFHSECWQRCRGRKWPKMFQSREGYRRNPLAHIQAECLVGVNGGRQNS
jgi:hypothetical protein